MFVTPFMGLTAWDLPNDPYDHNQLANNFDAIDGHDHTTGHGIQIPTGGIANLAVSTAKIADNAVTAPKIPDASITQAKHAKPSVGTPELIDGSVTTAKIVDGAVTAAKLAADTIPIGECILWYRADASVPLPGSFWEHLDGRAWSSVTNKMAPGGVQLNTGSMPDTRNAFPLGAALSGVGSGPTTPPDIGQAGGSHTFNLSHSHAVAAHAHTVPDHVHGISGDGLHSHLFSDSFGGFQQGHQRTTANPIASGFRQSFYIPNLNPGASIGDDVLAPMQAVGTHAHGGATTGSGAFTTSFDATTTDAQLSASTDHRPKFVGFLILCRVR